MMQQKTDEATKIDGVQHKKCSLSDLSDPSNELTEFEFVISQFWLAHIRPVQIKFKQS